MVCNKEIKRKENQVEPWVWKEDKKKQRTLDEFEDEDENKKL